LETRLGNRQLLHLVDQRSALQAKFGRCAEIPTEAAEFGHILSHAIDAITQLRQLRLLQMVWEEPGVLNRAYSH
jgi:hypothetical protein